MAEILYIKSKLLLFFLENRCLRLSKKGYLSRIKEEEVKGVFEYNQAYESIRTLDNLKEDIDNHIWIFKTSNGFLFIDKEDRLPFIYSLFIVQRAGLDEKEFIDYLNEQLA